MTKYPHCNDADQYARGVVKGKILANKWVTLACKNYLADLKAQRDPDFPYYFDSAAAEKAVKFVELMPHTKGKWARDKLTLKLEPWQKFFVCNIFGWMRKADSLRRYRQADLWVPRKNGKSALAAAIGLYMFVVDGEYGAEVYSGATTEKQAWEVFRPAQIMARKVPEFREAFGVEVTASNMHVVDSGSRFEPLIGNPGDGSSPHCAIVDEYHEHKDDRLVETMETGMGAREQPLLLMITTAGDNISGPCYLSQLEAQKILEGVTKDPTRFSLIYSIDEDDDWTSLDTLRKANPNMGVSVSEDFLANQLQQALNSPRKQSTYKTKHLNVWVGSRNAFFNVNKWQAAADESLRLEDFEGYPAYLALDLASKDDIAALELVIEDGDDFIHFGRHWLPEEKATSVEHYRNWMGQGLLNVTDGEIIDFAEIEAEILELCTFLDVQEVAYDPFQATYLATRLDEQGVPLVEVRPIVLNFSEPMKELDAMIRTRRIRHNGDPVFTWMLSNVTAKVDRKDNVYPNKEAAENKIDGPVALIMAIGRATQSNKRDISLAINQPLSVKL